MRGRQQEPSVIETPGIVVAPRGRGAATTEDRAWTDMAQHIEQYHPVRRELPNVYDWKIYRGLAAAWRWVRAGAHWYFTSPVPPILGLIGIVGLLIIGAIELGGGA